MKFEISHQKFLSSTSFNWIFDILSPIVRIKKSWAIQIITMGEMKDIAQLCGGACAVVGGVLVSLMSILNLSIGAAVSWNSSKKHLNKDAMN